MRKIGECEGEKGGRGRSGESGSARVEKGREGEGWSGKGCREQKKRVERERKRKK